MKIFNFLRPKNSRPRRGSAQNYWSGNFPAHVPGANWWNVTPEDFYLSCATVFACVRIISDTMATLPLRLIERDERGVRELDRDPLARVLQFRANQLQTASAFRKRMMMNLLLYGVALAHVVRSADGAVLRLVPVDPENIVAVRHDGFGGLYFEIRQYNGEVKKFFPGDVIFEFFHLIRSGNEFRYKSPISYGIDLVGGAKDAADYARGAVRNSRVPQGIFSTAATLDDEKYQALRADIDAMAGGSHRNNTLILDGGVDFKEIKQSAADLQLLETRRFSIDEICGFFGVAPYMIGQASQAKGWATTEGLFKEFINLTMLPYLRRSEEMLTTQLIPPELWGKRSFVYTFEEYARADTPQRAEFYTKLVNIGALSANEVRRMERMNPRPGGDVYLKPLNMEESK